MGFEVRHAFKDDGDELLDIWHEYTARLEDHDPRYDHAETADERWLSYFHNHILNSKYCTVLVAENTTDSNSAGKLVGVLEAIVTGDHPVFRLGDHGYVCGLHVRESGNEKRIENELLDAAEEWFRESPRGLDFYRVDVLDDDVEAAERLATYGMTPAEHVYEQRL